MGKKVTENTDYAAMIRRMLRAYGARVESGDVDDLAELIALRDAVDALIVPAIAEQMVEYGISWADVGRAAGMPKGNAHRKWAGDVSDYLASTGWNGFERAADWRMTKG